MDAQQGRGDVRADVFSQLATTHHMNILGELLATTTACSTVCVINIVHNITLGEVYITNCYIVGDVTKVATMAWDMDGRAYWKNPLWFEGHVVPNQDQQHRNAMTIRTCPLLIKFNPPQGLTNSHLCHLKSCTASLHATLEPLQRNISRNGCLQFSTDCQHTPKCINIGPTVPSSTVTVVSTGPNSITARSEPHNLITQPNLYNSVQDASQRITQLLQLQPQPRFYIDIVHDAYPEVILPIAYGLIGSARTFPLVRNAALPSRAQKLGYAILCLEHNHRMAAFLNGPLFAGFDNITRRQIHPNNAFLPMIPHVLADSIIAQGGELSRNPERFLRHFDTQDVIEQGQGESLCTLTLNFTDTCPNPDGGVFVFPQPDYGPSDRETFLSNLEARLGHMDITFSWTTTRPTRPLSSPNLQLSLD